MLSMLEDRFHHPDVRFSQNGEIVLIEMSNAYGSATLTPYGGTLLSYIPKGGVDLLWVSDTAVFDASKPVRGGVPVCWPWFGPYEAPVANPIESRPGGSEPDPSDAAKKAHGFARYEWWEVEAVRSLPEGATQVGLSLVPNPSIARVWPHDFRLQLVVTLGDTLRVDLIGENRSPQDWVVSEALHTYFRVGEAEGLVVRGLEDVQYIDKLQECALHTQTRTLCIEPPLDRVYLNHSGTSVIEDTGHGRQIELTTAGSDSTVVWNPGAEGTRAFADMPDAAYHEMVCVEAANALQNRYPLPAGASHTMSMILKATPTPT